MKTFCGILWEGVRKELQMSFSAFFRLLLGALKSFLNAETLQCQVFTSDEENGQLESRFISLVSNDDHKFTCNKKILSSKSDVFKTLFAGSENDQCVRFQEIEKNLIKIDDVDGETLREILRYVYFDVVDQNIMDPNPNLPFKCLLAAEKYMLDQKFKDSCQDFLVLSVDDENAFDYFRLAENLNAEQLKLSVGDYISQYLTHKRDVLP
uniref:BTB domain-containing protein n=1 Tax=Romanomermis culicivorax TaxID=13658 RepID=A0A915IIZ6_ROMCU